MSIGDNIKKLRLKYSLSQKELAEIAGVSDKAVSAWEKNRIVPRMGPIQRMADHFGIKKSDIIEPFPISVKFNANQINEDDDVLSDEEIKLVNGYRSLDNSQRQTLADMLAFLSSEKSRNNNVHIQSNSGNGNFFANNGNNYVNA